MESYQDLVKSIVATLAICLSNVLEILQMHPLFPEWSSSPTLLQPILCLNSLTRPRIQLAPKMPPSATPNSVPSANSILILPNSYCLHSLQLPWTISTNHIPTSSNTQWFCSLWGSMTPLTNTRPQCYRHEGHPRAKRACSDLRANPRSKLKFITT